MNRISFQIKATNFPSPPAHPNVETDGLNLENKVSPSVLLIIIILAVIFFISGLLHLLVRVLLRPPIREQEDHLDNVTDLQGQLQQLFHLHDAGVDQSFIDTLPVFQYKTIIGLKNPFDCAVCLCEFELEDKLRLLPRCSHAFHMECIDTWLLSHSTCPLCRASLLLDFSPSNICSPMVLVLESGSDSSREIVNDREACNIGRTSSVLTTNSHLGYQGDNELGSSRYNFSAKSGEVLAMEDNGEKVVPVKLGKFRNVDIGEGTSNNENADARRCYSMGSFEYVMDENSSLQVPIRTPMKKQSSKKPNLPLTPGHRPAMSECDCESRRGFNGFEAFKSKETSRSSAASLVTSNGRSKRESFSVSKVWLRGKNEKRNPSLEDSSRRALSFRFPVNCNATDDDFKVKINGNGGDEEENLPGMNSLACEAKTPSFARRTLLWLVGRPNKVVQSPSSSNS